MKQPKFDPHMFYPKDMLVAMLLDDLKREVVAVHQHVKLLVERGEPLISGVLLNDQEAYNKGWRGGNKRFELQYRANFELVEAAKKRRRDAAHKPKRSRLKQS